MSDEEYFICYQCRDGLHPQCVGVPCRCDCEIPVRPIDPHELCKCGHELYRHYVSVAIFKQICLGKPETLTLAGSCKCEKFATLEKC